MKFLVDLELDGYETEEERNEACREFIREQLNFSGSSVKIKELENDPEQEIQRLQYEIKKANNFMDRDFREIQNLRKQLAKEGKELSEDGRTVYYKGNSLEWWYARAKAYGDAIMDCWNVLAKHGVPPNGEMDIVDAIEKLAARSGKPLVSNGDKK